MAHSDPFVKMAEANKTYGFTIAVKELRETVPNIFRYAAAYKRKNNLKSKGLWEMFLEPVAKPETPPDAEKKLPEEILQTDPNSNNLDNIDPEAMEGESYNMCHFWSNFEIARLDWFRSKEYEDFFNMMDRSGGFWNERVSLFLFSKFAEHHTNNFTSGEMPLFIPLPQVPSSPRVTSTTSVISVTGTPRSNTARPTHRLDNFPVNLTLRRPRRMRRSGLRKMTTGPLRTQSRRTVSVADAAATPILWMSRASKAAV